MHRVERKSFVAGPEFGTVIRIVRALYGLKSSGASWRAMFNNSIREDIGFQPSIADPRTFISGHLQNPMDLSIIMSVFLCMLKMC